MFYNNKTIYSVSVLERTAYRHPLYKGRRLFNVGVRGTHLKLGRSQASLSRLRCNVRRLIWSNPDLTSWVNLTFADDVSSHSQANYSFKLFVQRVKRFLPDFKFVCCPEYHPSRSRRAGVGLIHYHMLCNFPVPPRGCSSSVYFDFNDWFSRSFWRCGFVLCEHFVDSFPGSAGIYMTKYISKSSFSSTFFNKKVVLRSKNLVTPSVFYDAESPFGSSAVFSRFRRAENLGAPFLDLTGFTLRSSYYGDMKFGRFANEYFYEQFARSVLP